jgi:hypothetical protein
LQQAAAELGSPLKERQSVAMMAGEGKVPRPVAKIGSQEIVQQVVAKIPRGHNIFLIRKINVRKSFPVVQRRFR